MDKKSIPTNFPGNLKDMRSLTGLSQAELGELLGHGQNHISYWEHGKIFPGIQSLIKLSAIFDVSLDSLLYYPDASKGRCNVVCIYYKKITRVEKHLKKSEMIRWRELETKIVDLMEIENEDLRRKYLDLLISYIEDIHRLALIDIVDLVPEILSDGETLYP
jgi:transcriptional regulator with XRE-family HTH domain